MYFHIQKNTWFKWVSLFPRINTVQQPCVVVKREAEKNPPVHQAVCHGAIQLADRLGSADSKKLFSADWAGWAEQRSHSSEVSITSGAGSSGSPSLMTLVDRFLLTGGSQRKSLKGLILSGCIFTFLEKRDDVFFFLNAFILLENYNYYKIGVVYCLDGHIIGS